MVIVKDHSTASTIKAYTKEIGHASDSDDHKDTCCHKH